MLGTEGREENEAPQHWSPSLTQLKHVQDGIVHLNQHSQMDGQAGLAVLRGGCARQPGKGVVLLQYEPEFEKYRIFKQVVQKSEKRTPTHLYLLGKSVIFLFSVSIQNSFSLLNNSYVYFD